ncbi:MAG TPA: hypothetical protein VGB75_12435 [Jatrophihabitans sp.]|uniref:hypothetical protein n=1 Tax=Jatrophihabitans sp. TaxID=1932789 RepID=UPI002F21A6E0
MTVSFIDTSILCNLLPVPGRDQGRAEVVAEFANRRARGETFILPVTAIIETGNFIAQVPDGRMRRATAQVFADLISLVAEGKAPWTMHQFLWEGDYLRRLVAGSGTAMTLVEHAVNGLGGGDLCILAERDLYRARSGITAVTIWTIDTVLAAHN